MSECGHRHRHPKGLRGAALAAALAQAEARCDAGGHRFTPIRRRTLDLLLRAGGPMKAYDLIETFSVDGVSTKPPTIYRALDFLTQRGLVHRIEGLNAFIACDVDGGEHPAAFLVCDCCGSAIEIEPPPSDAIAAEAARHGYKLHRVIVEAHGLCPDCAGEDRASAA